MAIDIRHLDEVRIVSRQDDGNSIIYNNFCGASHKSHDTIKPIIDALTISRNYMRTDNRKTVFVEGITDYYYLNAICEALCSKPENARDADIDFIPINGLGESSEYNKTLEAIRRIDQHPIILTDNDNAGRQFVKAAAGKVAAFTLSDALDDPNIKSIESLFGKDLTRYHIDNKRPDSAAIFAQKLTTIYDNLSSSTKQNFKKLIHYIQHTNFWEVTLNKNTKPEN